MCKSRRRRDEKAPWALNYESGEDFHFLRGLFCFITAEKGEVATAKSLSTQNFPSQSICLISTVFTS